MTGETEQQYELAVSTSPMRLAPDNNAECSNECLFGERLLHSPFRPENTTTAHPLSGQTSRPEDKQDVWIHVVALRDNYAGYIQKKHLQAIDAETADFTHWVVSRSTLVFSEASIKSPVLRRLPFLSKTTSQNNSPSPFLRLHSGGFVWSQHLRQVGEAVKLNPVELALSHFLGAPYLWGGCTPEGVDCSGLVQALAQAKGIDIPRDSGDQEAALPHSVQFDARLPQDIVYWPGHTGILIDTQTLLHATAHSLSCVIEPLDAVVQRAGEISSIKRLFTPKSL